MRYQLFGRSGLRVSELCLGAMTFGDGAGWTADAAESRAMFDAFAEAGGTFIDTANVYTGGQSERLVGEFVRSERDRYVVATKYTQGPTMAASGNSRLSMVRGVEASLKRLGLDHIDLYWLHLWDFTTPIDEVMRAFDDLVSAGKVLYVAASDTPAWEVSRANMLADLRGWSPLIGLQIEYSLLERTVEREFLPMARALDLGVVAWSPLAAGQLARRPGVVTDSERAKAGRMRPLDERKTAIIEAVCDLAEEIGRTPGQVALAWLRSRRPGGRVIPIVGARTAAQLKDNMACLGLSLDAAQLERLDAVSAIPAGFPYEILNQPRVRDMVCGGAADRLDNHRTR